MKKRFIGSLLFGALIMASSSMFVSCADYDDDINANKADIVAAQTELSKLKSDLSSLETLLNSTKSDLLKELSDVKSEFQTKIADAKAELNTAIAAKADQATVDALAQRVLKLEQDLVAKEAALNAKIQAIESSIAQLEALVNQKVDKSTFDVKIAELQALINGKVDDATFQEAKANIANLQTAVSNLQTLVATLATVSDIDNLTTTLNAKIETEVAALKSALAALQTGLDGKVSVETFNTLQATVDEMNKAISQMVNKDVVDKLATQLNALQVQVNSLPTKDYIDEKINGLKSTIEAALAGKASAAEVAELKARVDNLVSKNDLAEAKSELYDALEDLEEALSAIIDTKVDQVDFDEAVEKLDEARETIADILVTLAAINGDIEGLNKELDDLLQKLEDTAADLEGQIKDASEKLDGKITTLEGVLNGKISENAVAIKALEQQATAIATFLGDYENGTLAATLAELEKKLSEEAAAAVKKEKEERVAALVEVNNAIVDLKTELTKALNDQVTALTKKIGSVEEIANANKEDIKKLREEFTALSKKVNESVAYLDNFKVFVNRALQSISLDPQLFIGGIEAIEFTSVYYQPMRPGTSGLGRNMHNQYMNENPVTVDDGTAEAYYRLNPAIVERKSIDEEKIEFLSAIAETRATPYYGTEKPVEFNGIAAWNYNGQPGLIKVNLKKTITGSLNLGQNQTYIVALKVPRKADADNGIEAADIVSENSRLVENTITPRIAHLPWKGAPNDANERLQWKDWNNTIQPKATGYRIHHFTDSTTIWRQDVDANQMVYYEINYNETFNVRNIVTGCRLETPVDGVDHAGIDQTDHNSQAANELTKDQLAKYGLEFRFAIAGTQPGGIKEYKMDVDHSTDQQKFATIDPVTGILSSKVPQLDGSSVVDNRACVGKEPIIRIMLIDVKNKKLVDERYMKIKWVEPTKGTKDIGEYEVTTQLKPCALNGQVGVTWLWFIDKAYSKAEISGMSQQTFAQVYMDPNHLPTVGNVTYTGSHLSLLSPAVAPGKPVVKQTTNEQGDALIATWSLQPAEIANIYPNQSKTFTAKITFHSILPTEYPNLTMTFKWTITLPTLPEIEGYYDNYWFEKYTLHDVMPVQYNTAQYNLIKNGTIVPGKDYGIDAPAVGMQKYDKANNTTAAGTDYCVFYNSITNPFKYEVKSNVPQFIVKNLLGECSTWDMQFTWKGPDAIEKGYVWTGTNWNPRVSNNERYPQFGSYRPASNTNSPALSKINWKGAGAYKLETAAGAQALQLEWWGQKQDFHATGEYDQTDGNHVAWDNVNTTWGGKKYNYAVLYADHHNAANQALLNMIIPDKDHPIGTAPTRTHDNKVHLGIWGTLNDWNIIPIKDYDICLVEPLAINAELGGVFKDGYISGTAVRSDDAFTLTDFRGYEVKNLAATGAAATNEWTRYRQDLYKYYEVEEPQWDLANVKYGLKVVNGNVVSDDKNKMNAAEISQLTNGNIRLSVEEKIWNGVKYLVFKNNGGSNVEEECWIYIPVTAQYGFGTVTKESRVRLYPFEATGVNVLPYPGGDNNARQK